MGRTVEIVDGDVVIELSGWTAAAAIRRRLRIPREAIRSASTDRYERDGFRVGGTAIPLSDYRQGRFWKRGERTFLSFEDRARTVTLELDRARAGYDRVVLGVDDPEGFVRSLDGLGQGVH
jgi:hypothetical protein